MHDILGETSAEYKKTKSLKNKADVKNDSDILVNQTDTKKDDNNQDKKTIKQLDISQRPREILLEKGVGSLTDEQLLAILIDVGTKEHNAIEISKKLINYAGGIENLAKFDVNMVQNIKGIGTAKACKIVASIEFANRVVRARAKNEKLQITSPKSIVDMFSYELDRLNIEVFKIICLNTKNNIIYTKNLTVGVANASIVTSREVFKEAILRHSSAIIVMHNHPSGDCSPSKQDIDVTNKLVEASKVIDIKLVDHIIYGNVDNYYSFKENGYID